MLMERSYWTRYWDRRRVLKSAGWVSAGAASLALVGCGDDDDDDGGATPTSGGGGGLATSTPDGATPTPDPDYYASVKRGGTYRGAATGDPASIDPYGSPSFTTKGIASYVYSRLFKYNAGRGVNTADLVPEPDLCESAEVDADGTTWTLTLRENAKFHDKAPVNGRAVTTEDVNFSWQKMTDPAQPNAGNVAFVERLEFPDDRTMVFTLKEPNAAFADVFADANNFWVVPTESDGGFNPAETMIGSGPWMFDTYQVNSGYSFNRNPAWHFDGFPLMDRVEISIIPEVANRLAQFQAGSLHAVDVSPDNVISLNEQMPHAQMIGEVTQLNCYLIADSDPNSPWNNDDRIRIAISKAFDRETLLDFGYNVSNLKAAGLEVSEKWNNLIPAGNGYFWLDPLSDAQGPSRENFLYDPAASRQMLEQAGYPNGIETKYIFTPGRYGSVFDAMAEAHIEMLREAGFNVTVEPQDYNSVYFPNTFRGNFSGLVFLGSTPFPEMGGYPLRFFTDNPLNHGKVNDPELRDLAVRQQRELDREARREMFFDIQRKNAEKMYYSPLQWGAGTGWAAYQPTVRNLEVRTVPSAYSGATEVTPFRWLDV